ncbi:MAG: hypothetical protein HDR45_06880 [Bacteroides sp.]|nr:hypothetical protein [Bacteroidales bacterium]MBD5326744.1 hypothetical protein [Bacteroides sp.]MDE6222498.1 hypothetical protein [Muribaculaceae bacterium]MBD5328085.1 hypothetical protein [Bacteroides sp.]MBD5415795.1 hypothetical protein [Bacteroides sp.]
MKTSKIYNEQNYPGAGIDVADHEKVNARLEKQYTRRLNNNPRNDQ